METFILAKRLKLVFLVLLCVLATGIVGYSIMGLGPVDALYMVVITLTTTGYQEIGGNMSAGWRLFTIFILLSGMGTLLYAISTATAFIVEGEVGNMLRRRKTEKKIALLEGHFILCGLSHIGIYAFSEIRKSQRPIVIINREQKAIDALALTPGDDLLYIIGDASADSVLEQAGIRRASGLISAFEDDMANIYVTLTARNLNPKIRIISRAWDASAQAKLLQAGADSTISTDRIGGQRMVSQMLHPAAVTFLDRMLARQDEVLRIENVEIVRHAAIEGRTLGEARIRERFDLLAMAVRDATSREFLFNPSLDYVLKARDVLIVMGETTRISRLREAGSQRARGVLGALETKTILKRVVKSAGGE